MNRRFKRTAFIRNRNLLKHLTLYRKKFGVWNLFYIWGERKKREINTFIHQG